MNMQYTIKTEDIQHKGEGKGLMDNAASELMAISMSTSIIFALPQATWFEFISTRPENILLTQNSVSMFPRVSIPSSLPSQEILLAWKKAGGDSASLNGSGTFTPKNAKYTNKKHVQGVNKDLKTQKNLYMTHYIWAGIRKRDEFIINTAIARKFLKATAVPTLITFS